MRKNQVSILIVGAAMLALAYGTGSCRKTQDGGGLHYVQQQVPAGFPQPVYRYTDNPISEEGIELGRRLFYDGRLSVDSNHPCSSCHQQIGAFGTYQHDRSHGVHMSHTLRNAPPLFNLAWASSYHWDGQYTSLVDESANPINGQLEMGENFNSVIRKISDDPMYKKMFREVFHTLVIKPIHIQKALAQFTGSIISANSRYDKYKRGEVSFTTAETNGYQVFQAHCETCHTEPLFTDYSYRNIGLPILDFLSDFGRMRITGNAADSLKFRVPTLRNVNITANFMHDGRFGTLSQVVEHYRHGVQAGPTLDPAVAGGITMTDAQASDLVLFLRTLTDSTILTNTNWGPPH